VPAVGTTPATTGWDGVPQGLTLDHENLVQGRGKFCDIPRPSACLKLPDHVGAQPNITLVPAVQSVQEE